jgi:hypothetical protein
MMTTPNPVGILAIAACVLCPVAMAVARDCDFDVVPADKQPARITLGGDKVVLAERRRVPCATSVAVEEGRIYLVFDDKGKLTRKECKANQTCRPSPEARAFLWQLVAGLPDQHAGGKRMDQDVHVPLGLPVGLIYSVARASTFDFSAVGGGQWSLTLARAGGRTPLVRQAGSERLFVVPPGRLERGGKYEWTVVTSRGHYKAGFDVLGAADATEVERDLRDKGISGTGATREQKLDELMVLFDHGLDYEAKLLARELGL